MPPPPQGRLCRRRRPQIEDFQRQGGAALPAVGLGQEGGGAGVAGEGDHQHCGGGGAGVGRGRLDGAAEKLAIAHRTGREAIAGPLGGDGLHGPAEALGSGGDGAIRTTGTAMKHQLHQPAGSGGGEGRRHTKG